MISPVLVLVIILLIGLGGSIAAWYLFRRRQPVKENITENAFPFRWKYIVLPVAMFFLSLLLTAIFYPQLPAELAYDFQPDGSADSWFSREIAVVSTLVPQLLLTLLAVTLTWGITKLSIPPQQTQQSRLRLERVVSLMGNMVALPQIIICFALVDIFSYNLHQTHIMPLWLFAVIIMALGAIVLGILFISAVGRSRGAA